MASRARRLARGWAASLIATGLGAASHAAVDGTWPPVILMLLSASLAAPVCMLLGGKVLSRVSVAAAVVASQGLFHSVFAQAGHGITAVDHTHHAVGAVAEGGPQLVVTTAPDLVHHGAGMLAAHIVAAVATYLLLRHGEVAAMRLVDAVSLRVSAWVSVPLPPMIRTVPRRIAWTSPRALTDQLLLPVVHGFRGPPARVTVPVLA
ncbi:hypothetical protein IEE91_02405 [Kocuria sp. cx-455]|uniref:hypothetical protein n=1 Tax=unclassified Candidatus Sulfotelmatobacter TaxID=2635724 RepID=UPI0016871BF2|nr:MULTISPECIES: hypothetical protein [unclassified Candidatus Sulfotelmatobacter]MBD2761667.1 hypothetical protein [Kocuria sp. cx-116]MBD2764060.1 hypothetical protein [Kocuria sp. cx-455]